MKNKSILNLKKIGLQTRAVKTYLDGKKENRPLTTPMLQATNFQAQSSESLGALFKEGADTVYMRFGHPTLNAAAEKVAALEGAEMGLVFGSGMGAITAALLTALEPGDHVVAQRQIFAQTFTFLDTMARSFGIETDFVDATNKDEIIQALRPNTALIYIETPSNPLLQIVHIQAISEIAMGKNVPLFVDRTFASPYLQNPLALGANLVLHSGTKFLGGHSDVMCGLAAGDAHFIRQMRETQILLGSVLDANSAWLLLRGIKTLGVRVQRQSENALEIARFLEAQTGTKVVHYPWLESSPCCEIARAQMRGGGGMLSFEVEKGLRGARAFLDALELIPIATSLGGVETIIEIPLDLDFSEEEIGDASRETGISPGLIRLSVGIEDIEDLIGDLERGVSAIM